ncbi:uncharacterized protein LOC110697749 isoform X2 [Chenopodium quinoa]|uniref:uncharacterized protein LOC110697749 isoform X2 n=1 Tax=Chenopodium quinoa TaxID=63459 RepID=UPI000B77C7FB|nr:uncharacterized protein LOC110697749 isoform X2 [Chenopodium quinoa]
MSDQIKTKKPTPKPYQTVQNFLSPQTFNHLYFLSPQIPKSSPNCCKNNLNCSNQQSKAFDKLTDRVEDRQLDSSRVQTAMGSITAVAETEVDVNSMRLSKMQGQNEEKSEEEITIIPDEKITYGRKRWF